MKKVILITFLSVLSSSFLLSQNNITLNLNHKLGMESVAPGVVGQNNLDHSFNLSRLQYYISEITIIHDGGKERALRELWVLVNAFEPTVVDLGTHDVDHIESIKFSIGVDPEHNHLDPSSYQTGHPLAPIFPSMHWGWAAGYRFVAMEGNCGNNLNLTFQLHALGDNNYFRNEVDINKSAANGILHINIDADYARALEDINMQSGVIVHGDNLEAQELLHNFRDYVFSAETSTNTHEQAFDNNAISIFPNPSKGESITLTFDLYNSDSVELQVFDLNGRLVLHRHQMSSGYELNCSGFESGMYLINIMNEGSLISSRKLIIE